MGKSSKKKLEARLTEADAGVRDLESTRAALTEELRSERERHAEETTALRREHEQLVDEIKRSTRKSWPASAKNSPRLAWRSRRRPRRSLVSRRICATGTSIHARCCKTSTTPWKRRSGGCPVR